MTAQGRKWTTLRQFVLAAAACVILGLAAFWIVTPGDVSASALPPRTPNLDNGKTMFNIGGCASCHAAPSKDPHKADRTRLGGGLALQSPFGIFYAPNISPDPKDGIGAWSEADFVSAMWDGTAPDGCICFRRFPILPAHAAQRRARSVCLPENAAAGPGRVRRHDLAFPSTSGGCLAAGNCCFCTVVRSCPIRRNRRNGIAALIW